MHVLLITSGLTPYPGLQGTTFVAWSILQTLQEMGHQVSVAVLRRGTHYDGPEMMRPMEEAGIPHYVLEPAPEGDQRPSGRLEGLLNPRLADSYEEVRFTRPLRALVDRIQPDVLYMFAPRSVAATTMHDDWPVRVASTVDLDHIARYERVRFDLRYGQGLSRFVRGAERSLQLRRMAQHSLEVLKPCDRVFSHAAHHAAWLKEQGISQAIYSPLPILDVGADVARRRLGAAPGARDRLRLIAVGSTRGIATLTGFPLLVDEILPALDRELGPDGYELHIIGIMQGLPPRLEAPLRGRHNVKVRGYVDDLSAEFLQADVFLVPTPIDLGFRVRIGEGFSYGACVVAHTANQQGMPELVHGENVLLGNSGEAIAALCAEVQARPALKQQIGAAARETFERDYDAQKVCRRIVAVMENEARRTSMKQVVN